MLEKSRKRKLLGFLENHLVFLKTTQFSLKTLDFPENHLVFIENRLVFPKTTQFPVPLSTAPQNISSQRPSHVGPPL
jgi:hypothetical protein